MMCQGPLPMGRAFLVCKGWGQPRSGFTSSIPLGVVRTCRPAPWGHLLWAGQLRHHDKRSRNADPGPAQTPRIHKIPSQIVQTVCGCSNASSAFSWGLPTCEMGYTASRKMQVDYCLWGHWGRPLSRQEVVAGALQLAASGPRQGTSPSLPQLPGIRPLHGPARPVLRSLTGSRPQPPPLALGPRLLSPRRPQGPTCPGLRSMGSALGTEH